MFSRKQKIHSMSTETTTSETNTEQKASRTSRRSMLRLAVPAAAGAAALAAAAATDVMRPGSAQAKPLGLHDGATMNIGAFNSAHSNTWLDNADNGSSSPVDDTLIVLDWTASQGSAVRGYTSAVLGRSITGIGVVGISNQSEYFGGTSNAFAKNEVGVYGLVNNPSGTPFGAGVVAHSINGTAPLAIVPQGQAGATGQGAAIDGAVWADSNGALFNAKYSDWYPMSSVVLLGAPTRLLDSRVTPGPAATLWHAPLSANQIRALQVGGKGGIPNNAKAVIGNITILGPTANGNLSFFPTGAAVPTTASITFLTGAFLANFNMTGLGTGGQVTIQNQSSGNTDLVFDAVGYVI